MKVFLHLHKESQGCTRPPSQPRESRNGKDPSPAPTQTLESLPPLLSCLGVSSEFMTIPSPSAWGMEEPQTMQWKWTLAIKTGLRCWIPHLVGYSSQ